MTDVDEIFFHFPFQASESRISRCVTLIGFISSLENIPGSS